MPAPTSSTASRYPASTSWVTTGELGRSREEFDRTLTRNAEPTRRLQAWQDRLRVAEALIANATPDSDFRAVAAALAERDTLKRHIGDEGNGLTRVQLQVSQDLNLIQARTAMLESEYFTACDFLGRVERGALAAQDLEAQRARRRLLELAGEPPQE